MRSKEHLHIPAAAHCQYLHCRSSAKSFSQWRVPLIPLAIWLTISLIISSVQPAYAHTEGKMQLAAQPAGPYKMTVFTSPDPATIGEIHVAALIFKAENATPVLDAEVTVTLESVDDGGTPLSVPANLGDAENKLLFEAIMLVEEPGIYKVTIAAADSEVGSGEASFELEVVSDGGFNWLYLIPVLAVVLIAVLWLLSRARRNISSP